MEGAEREFEQIFSKEGSFQERAESLIGLISKTLEIKRVDKKVDEEICFYVMDMSSFRIRVSSQTLFVVVNPEAYHKISEIICRIKETINTGRFEEEKDTKRMMINRPKFNEQVTFILSLDGDAKSLFKPLWEDVGYKIAVLGQVNLSKIIKNKSPHRAMVKLLVERVSLITLSPYKYLGPVSEGMFYGRKEEIKELLDQTKNFAIVGSRGTGKSSIIKHIFRKLLSAHTRKKEQEESPVALYSCLDVATEEEVTDGIVKQINIDEWKNCKKKEWQGKMSFNLKDFLRRMRDYHKNKIILCLDEVDALVKNQNFLNKLRSASDLGYCKLIMTGYKELFTQTIDKKSPLYNFLEPIRLEELDETSAKNLILEPMKELDIKIDNDVVQHLLKQSGRYPKILQFYCHYLIEYIAQKGAFAITMEDVSDIEKSKKFNNYLIDVFMMGTTKVERLFVFVSLSLPEQFKVTVLHKKLADEGIRIGIEWVDREIHHLALSNILERNGDDVGFSYSILRQTLQRLDVKYRIEQLKEDPQVISKLKEVPSNV